MKTLREIKQAAEKGDYTRVAETIGISADLVKKVVNDLRTDHHNIQRTFSDMLEARERMAQRILKRNKQKLAA